MYLVPANNKSVTPPKRKVTNIPYAFTASSVSGHAIFRF
jgi:hypothetical protein